MFVQAHVALISWSFLFLNFLYPKQKLLFLLSEHSNFFEKQEELNGTYSIQATGTIVYRSDAIYEDYYSWVNFETYKKGHVYGSLVFPGDKTPDAIDTPIVPICREKVEFYHIKNAFVSGWFEIVLSNGSNLFLNRNPCRSWPQYKAQTIVAKQAYKYGVFTPIYWPNVFGHWVNDGLSGLVLIPQWVWNLNPVLVHYSDINLIRDHLDAVGLGHIQCVSAKGATFVENLFFCKADEAWNGLGITSYPIIQKKFSEYYQLDKIKPTQYVFMNKNPGTARHFYNFQEIINATRIATGINWIEVNVDVSNRVETAHTFASFLICVMSSGSLGFNVLYMHEKTGVVPLMAFSLDYPHLHITSCCNIWCICVMHPEMPHKPASNPSNGNGNVTAIVQAAVDMVYTIKHDGFPPNLFNLFNCYDIDYIQKVYFTYGDYWVTANNDVKAHLPIMYANYLNSTDKTFSPSKRKLHIID